MGGVHTSPAPGRWATVYLTIHYYHPVLGESSKCAFVEGTFADCCVAYRATMRDHDESDETKVVSHFISENEPRHIDADKIITWQDIVRFKDEEANPSKMRDWLKNAQGVKIA